MRQKKLIILVCFIHFIVISNSVRASPRCYPITFNNIGIYFEGINYFNNNDSEVVNKIIKKLVNLPEVKAKNSYVDSLTKHAKGVSFRVMLKPGKLAKYYWIAVGYDSNLRFETYYNFYVWPDKMIIKYLDTNNGKTLSLAEWRRNKKD